jgi:hypothetical protein
VQSDRGLAVRVQNQDRGALYRCTTSSRDQTGCPHHLISAHIIDGAVLRGMQPILSQHAIVRAEVARHRRDDLTRVNREAGDVWVAETERRRTNLAQRVATIVGDEIAGVLLAEIAAQWKAARSFGCGAICADCSARIVRIGAELAQ